MRRALNMAFTVVMLASIGLAQETIRTDRKPIEAINIKVSQPDDEWLRIEYTVRNISEKDVTDYILILTFLDEQERSVGSEVSVHESYFSPMRRLVLHQGETFDVAEDIGKSSLDCPADSIKSVRIEPDFVSFTDRSSWGLNKSSRAFALGCDEAGAAMERRRLKEILATKGTDALLEDLSRETLIDMRPRR